MKHALVFIIAVAAKTEDPSISEKLLEAAFKCRITGDRKALVDKVFTVSPECMNELVENTEFESERDFWAFVNMYSAQIEDFEFIRGGMDIHGGPPDRCPEYITRLESALEGMSEDKERERLKTLIGVANTVNDAWKEIYVRQNVFPVDKRLYSTMVQVRNPFVIPGERFRECYYWDSYWAIEGLLNTGMYDAAIGMVENFILLIETHGFIPNGLRTYYLRRSQPPLFCMMLFALYRHIPWIRVKDVVAKGLRAAKKEHRFFMSDRHRAVERNGRVYDMNIYKVSTRTPRPESYIEDRMLAEEHRSRREEDIWTDLKSAAESGWDFSTRWMRDKSNLSTTRTSSIVPVDLNTVMYANELIISRLSEILEGRGSADAEDFRKRADARLEAINAVLWNPEEKEWNDYDYNDQEHTSRGFYVSNLLPMCYGIAPPEGSVYDILKKHSLEIFGRVGGMPASGEENAQSTQQWDYPNVWPPLVHIMAFFLDRIGETEMALHVARSLISNISVSTSRLDEGYRGIFEKYNCEHVGEPGRKGEYQPQKGFGWTNGSAIHFLRRFSTSLLSSKTHEESYRDIAAAIENKVRRREDPKSHSAERCLLLDHVSPQHAVPMETPSAAPSSVPVAG